MRAIHTSPSRTLTRIGKYITRSVLAGVLATLASTLCAQHVTDADGLHYHLTADQRSAELTFLANDSTNAEAYMGDIEVPDRVIYAGQWVPVTGVTPLACAGCDGLTSIVLPEGITTLGLGALSACSSLREVTLPQSLSVMYDLAFYCDSSLTSVAVPAGVERLGAGTFAFCMQLDSVRLHMGLRSIAPRAFYYCPSLRQARIPASVVALGEYAFAFCTGLEEVVMGCEPIAITPDVFEGVDIASCRLVVPTEQVEAYREADVWREFQIVDGGYESLGQVEADGAYAAFDMEVHGDELWLTVSGDAPALVYDLAGRRIAVAASRSGLNRIVLARGRNYIIRCGRVARTVALATAE